MTERERWEAIRDDWESDGVPESFKARLVAEMEERIAELEEKDRAVEAMFSLVGSDVAFVSKSTPEGYWAGRDPDATGQITFNLLCGDTFEWACADSEEIDLLAAPMILEIYREGGWPAVKRWVQEQRGGPEESPFIKPVAESIDKWDEREKRIAELEEERARWLKAFRFIEATSMLVPDDWRCEVIYSEVQKALGEGEA